MEVVIKNIGTKPVTSRFWVDLSVDPRRPPMKVNDICPILASEGIVWGVIDIEPLVPGGSITLTLASASASVSDSLTTFTGFTSGMKVYVQVDSANSSNSAVGGVLESHEITGGP